MDAAGIDQVMIFPSTFVYLPLVENADAAYICARAYNDWAYDYCSADKKRLYPAAVLPVQNVDYAIEELRRVAKRGFKSALVRPIIAQGKYPTFPEFDPLWREFEELGMVLGMHTFPSSGEAMSPELDERMGANRKRLFSDEDIMVYSPGQFVANIMQIMGSKQAGDAAYGFIAEAMTWTGVVLMTGWLEKFPRLKVAILESNSSWLPLVLEKAETYLDLYKHLGEKIGDPHDVFYKHCFIAFESDEMITLRLWDLYENIALWSSDMPHLDASDVWEAIDNMNKWKVPQNVHEKMLGGNARRLVRHRAAVSGYQSAGRVSAADDVALRVTIEVQPVPIVQTVQVVPPLPSILYAGGRTCACSPPSFERVAKPALPTRIERAACWRLSFIELLDKACRFDFLHQARIDESSRIRGRSFGIARRESSSTVFTPSGVGSKFSG